MAQSRNGARMPRLDRGFTAIELMTVLIIVAILMGIAAPAFHALIRNQRMTTTVNDFLFAVNLTRSEAIHRGSRVDLVPAGDKGDWSAGWLVLIDGNGNRKADPGEQLIFAHGPVASGITIQAAFTDSTVQYLAYTGSGRTRTNSGSQTPQVGSWTFRLDEQTRKIVISFLGRPRICKPKNRDAAC
jgi:type IV fimbrial biogenesis protein FimT